MKKWMLLVIAAAMCAGVSARAEDDLFARAPWSGGVGVGAALFEGDEELQNGPFLALRLGYDFNPHWTLEGDLNYAPQLSKRTFDDGRYEMPDDTYMLRLGVDVLLHLRHMTRNLQWDPYLALGGCAVMYGEDTGADEGNSDLAVTAGAGLMYHFNDVWAVRGDARLAVAGTDTEFNTLVSIGVNYRFGAARPPAYRLTGGELDSDGDGLTDDREREIRTDPFDPDSDDDQLTDGEEVLTYQTDPLNADSDYDGLTDGAEVKVYKTQPLDIDTDDGGVADGHEVIEDNTDPLNPADDLQLFTLNIEFDYDKAILRPQYFSQLDVIAKVLQRDPGATARIEGHADKRKTSEREYNLNLSSRRAKAVEDYLVNQGGIERARLASKGYGFDRPVAPNDTETHMQKNRRTEIYIRKGTGEETSTREPAPVPEPAGEPTPAPAP